MKNTRGFAAAAIIPYLLIPLVVAGGYQAWKVFAPGRNTKKADQVAESAANTQAQTVTVDQQATNIKKAVDEVKAATAEEIATREKMAKNAVGFSETAKEVLKGDPSDEAEIASTLIQYSIDSLGVKLTKEEQEKFARIAKGLIEKNAKLRADLEKAHTDAVELATSLNGEVDRRKTAEDTAKTLVTEHAAITKQLVSTATVSAKLANENKVWADGAETLWDRIKALGWLAVILVVIALLVGFKFLGVKATLTDSVALLEHVKTQAVAAGHDAADLEHKIHTWWEGSKNEQVISSIKSNVLRQ